VRYTAVPECKSVRLLESALRPNSALELNDPIKKAARLRNPRDDGDRH
jgi:hypothetical protein